MVIMNHCRTLQCCNCKLVTEHLDCTRNHGDTVMAAIMKTGCKDHLFSNTKFKQSLNECLSKVYLKLPCILQDVLSHLVTIQVTKTLRT